MGRTREIIKNQDSFFSKMIDPVVVLEVMAAIIIAVYLGKILTVAFKVVFYALLFTLVMVFVFGVSYPEMIEWVTKVILWVL